MYTDLKIKPLNSKEDSNLITNADLEEIDEYLVTKAEDDAMKEDRKPNRKVLQRMTFMETLSITMKTQMIICMKITQLLSLVPPLPHLSLVSPTQGSLSYTRQKGNLNR